MMKFSRLESLGPNVEVDFILQLDMTVLEGKGTVLEGKGHLLGGQ